MTVSTSKSFLCDNNLVFLVRYLKYLKAASELSEVATALKRDPRKVSQDLSILEQHGIVGKITEAKNITWFLTDPENEELSEAIKRAEFEFIKTRAQNYKLDAKSRLEWIDDLFEMIQTGRKNIL